MTDRHNPYAAPISFTESITSPIGHLIDLLLLVAVCVLFPITIFWMWWRPKIRETSREWLALEIVTSLQWAAWGLVAAVVVWWRLLA